MGAAGWLKKNNVTAPLIYVDAGHTVEEVLSDLKNYYEILTGGGIIFGDDFGDSSGGVVEIVALGMPAGAGEPVFYKLDGELGRLMSIGAVKAVEVGAGFAVKDMTGYDSNDRMRAADGKIQFDSNNAGGITGGLTTGQPILARIVVKPTPTIDKTQNTVDKYTMENKTLSAITRRDPTIVGRIWPVAESLTAILLLDHLIAHYGYTGVRARIK